MNKQMSMCFVQDELDEVKTNKTALLEQMSFNEFDEANRPIRLTETTTMVNMVNGNVRPEHFTVIQAENA